MEAVSCTWPCSTRRQKRADNVRLPVPSNVNETGAPIFQEHLIYNVALPTSINAMQGNKLGEQTQASEPTAEQISDKLQLSAKLPWDFIRTVIPVTWRSGAQRRTSSSNGDMFWC